MICLAAGSLFAALFIVYFYKYWKLSGQLADLNNQLDESLKKCGEDSVLVYSDEPAVRQLAARVNRLLEQQGSLTARARLQEERERRMLVNISHDLKTPLTVVYGYAEMLLAPEQNLAPAVRTKVEKYMPKPGMCWICCCSFLIWQNGVRRAADGEGENRCVRNLPKRAGGAPYLSGPAL